MTQQTVEHEPQTPLASVICDLCNGPIARFNPAMPIGLSIRLTAHRKQTGHGAEHYYTVEPGVVMRFENGPQSSVSYTKNSR